MKTIYLTVSTIIVVVTSVLPLWAQGSPPATPIDGGMSLLLIVGGIYGIKKIKGIGK